MVKTRPLAENTFTKWYSWSKDQTDIAKKEANIFKSIRNLFRLKRANKKI